MNIKNINKKAHKYRSESKENFKLFSHKELMKLPPYNGILNFSINNITFEMLNINNDDGIVTKYEIVRSVKAVSGETKTKTVTVGSPTQYLKLTLTETNVIEINQTTTGIIIPPINKINLSYKINKKLY